MSRVFPWLLVVLISTFAIGRPALAVEFIRGDCNQDGMINIADVISTFDFAFGGAVADCKDAFDANDDGEIDIADPVYTLAYLFSMGSQPASPFPDCGEDLSADNLDCESNKLCGLGGPIMGLTDEQLMAFNRGREIFNRSFTVEEGLGPMYNSTSCESCHGSPIPGGSSQIYRNFFLVALGDVGSAMGQHSLPDLPSLVMPSFNLEDGGRPAIPTAAAAGETVTIAQRNSPPLFGTGLFEFISNNTIISNSDPDDLITPDGISGRFNQTSNLHIGRFGYKAQANMIESFNRGALQNQMGITSDAILGTQGVNQLAALILQVGSDLDDPTVDNDGVQDPEISVDDLEDLLIFGRFLAPPKKKAFDAAASNGEILFASLGCDKCHIPSLNSSMGPVEAYTDLLLHDMGATLADGISMGIPQPSAISPNNTASEFRTQPLWGVSLTAPYLHDGRADTLDEAILLHGGEAQSIRDAYSNLSQQDRDDIISFLEAL